MDFLFVFFKNKGKIIDAVVVGQDIPATILEMYGVNVPKFYQGVSGLHLIEKKNAK